MASGDVLTDPWGDYLVRHHFVSTSLKWFVVDSGFFQHEDPEIHRLSYILLKLVTLNFLLNTVFFTMVAVEIRTTNMTIASSLVVAASFVIFRASVMAIQTRNRPFLCGMMTYMGAFQLFSLLCAVAMLYATIYHVIYHVPKDLVRWHLVYLIGMILSLGLVVVGAEYARQLRKVLPPSSEHVAPTSSRGKNKRRGSTGQDNAVVVIEEEVV